MDDRSGYQHGVPTKLKMISEQRRDPPFMDIFNQYLLFMILSELRPEAPIYHDPPFMNISKQYILLVTASLWVEINIVCLLNSYDQQTNKTG